MKFPHCGNFNVDFLTCGNNSLTSSAKWEIKLFMFQYARGKFRAIITLKLLYPNVHTHSYLRLLRLFLFGFTTMGGSYGNKANLSPARAVVSLD